LAVAGSAGVSVLLGTGDGTFQAAVNYPAGSFPRSVAVGDFNGDGFLDLAVANVGTYPNYTDSSVSVLLGKGDRTFHAARSFAAGNRPGSGRVGDFHAAGRLDLVVVNAGSNNVSVLLGNGDGTFQAARTFAAGPSPNSVAVGDFNGDGRPDLVVANDTF